MFESYEIPNEKSSLSFQRRSLPQIDVGALKKDSDFKIKEKEVDTDSLTPTQKHFNDDKVMGMINSGKTFGDVVVSNDGYVIDGHHRFLAQHNTSGKVKVLELNDTIENLLDRLNDKPYVEKKKLMEAKTLEQFMEEAKLHISI